MKKIKKAKTAQWKVTLFLTPVSSVQSIQAKYFFKNNYHIIGIKTTSLMSHKIINKSSR